MKRSMYVCACVYTHDVCAQASVQNTKYRLIISFSSSCPQKFDAGGQILFMLSSGITGIQISKHIEQPYQAFQLVHFLNI